MKKIIGVLLAVFILGGSTFAFAYWDQLETTEDNVTVSVGQGVTLEVVVNSGSITGNLIPTGAIQKTGDVYEAQFTYDVNLDVAVIDALDLIVVASNVLIDGVATNAGLVNIVIDPATTTILNDIVVVTVTVTLDMPADQTAYDAVANKDITFDLTFTASE